ncbi:sodium/calcium exchanger protein-like protein [Macroventuria anomochaeta]|uniref:Sodium/calcium exchanger protein-like protein n=1 Tax=Macroventuria anomochaeta TaxID=301207 RepID=A0ACB6RU66_9PLEO|nr:sodium/calcium exchanger protein-like protein [Macroventuria anomochaeta]KAF2624397.1 sodium/calcium exchanger protein-like protein [Macroventuria anomochaeta]
MNERSILDTVQRWRRAKYSARPFALTLLAITLIAVLAWAKEQRGAAPGSDVLRKRDVTILDEECRLVHHAPDQCAFVLANCPDEEAGVISYLTLYYCRLPHAKPVAFAMMTLWLALLFSTIGIAASDFFCVNLSTIASMLGMSESLAGVTLLAFGNGSPDVFSTFAAFRTHAASLAVGELIGAASFITAVVSGSMALIRPFNVARKSFVRDVGFFIVAAGFSMGFIVDGKLHLWEAVSMVAFYLFYVVFVVAWHWWLNQRKARRLKAPASRSHHVTPGGEEEEIPQYFDDDDAAPANSRTPSRGVSIDDFHALERAGGDPMDADENEEERGRWMGEMSNNMRVSRPPLGARRPTQTLIRPSLVGALEFRAVLSSLQKSRNIQAMPISLRRYSDDPSYTTAQQQDLISTTSDPAPRPPFDVASVSSAKSPSITRPTLEVQQNINRTRAVSTNDLDSVRLQPSTLQGNLPHISFAPATPDLRDSMSARAGQAPPSPTISLSPPPSQLSSRVPSPLSSRAPSPAPSRNRGYSDLLAPPGLDSQGLSQRSGTSTPSPLSSPVLGPGDRPAPPNLKLTVPGAASPPLPFPTYTDFPWSAHSSSRAQSLRLPSPSVSPESAFHNESLFGVYDVARTPRWWPSQFLPAPYVFLSTLFPTLTSWRDKNIWDKLLGLVAALPVLLLTITLPVVEPASNDDDQQAGHPDLGLPSVLTPVGGTFDPQFRLDGSAPVSRSGTDPSKLQKSSSHQHNPSYASNNTTGSVPPQLLITTEENIMGSPEQLPENPFSAHPHPSTEPKQWNRWLVIIQTFTAPFFILLVVWANVEPEDPRALLRQTMYSLIASLVMLAFILLTTTPNRPPRWRQLLCFLGFAVAIAWISTIANEVVGVLRTLGVILNMSDAILGLTIFAVGNSLGDLVADITVARLGFPVMALSACFGGPMLNILLGIGLSGTYMILTKGEHRHDKHPNEPIHFKPYHIAVSTTLVISGASLLVTLAGLLVAVPVRKWRMDKWIGWGLVATWTVSTAANVLVETLGFSSDVS